MLVDCRMNEILQRKIRPTTQRTAGVPRLRWTLAEFERLAELGFFTDEEHIEPIGGELVPLAPKTVRHASVPLISLLVPALAVTLADLRVDR